MNLGMFAGALHHHRLGRRAYDRVRPDTMVLVEEVADGGWGIGDNVLTRTMLNTQDRT